MDAETWISLASAAVALAALGLTVWEAKANRRHNRLSVAPRLRLDFAVHPENEDVSISLVNAGLGPAIIDSMELMLDRQPTTKELATLSDVARAAGVRGTLRFATVLSGEVLNNGARLELISMDRSVFQSRPDQNYETPFRRIGVRVHYRSMYDQAFTCVGHGTEFLPHSQVLAPADRILVQKLVGPATETAEPQPTSAP